MAESLGYFIGFQIVTDSMPNANNQRVSSTLNCPIHSFQSIDAPLPPPSPSLPSPLLPFQDAFLPWPFDPFPFQALFPFSLLVTFSLLSTLSALTFFSNPFGPFESSLSSLHTFKARIRSPQRQTIQCNSVQFISSYSPSPFVPCIISCRPQTAPFTSIISSCPWLFAFQQISNSRDVRIFIHDDKSRSRDIIIRERILNSNHNGCEHKGKARNHTA
ncbi:hypothetical protein FOXYSP1_09515 [Fusarium oxysporum f. sp. phaseoli]